MKLAIKQIHLFSKNIESPAVHDERRPRDEARFIRREKRIAAAMSSGSPIAPSTFSAPLLTFDCSTASAC
jgi:hypothetical protein